MPTEPLNVTTIVTATMMQTVMVPQFGRGAGDGAMDLGDPLRGRAIRCNLPSVDFRFYPCRLRELRSLRAALAKNPATPCRSFGHRAGHRPFGPRVRASRCARRTTRVAGAGFARHRPAHRAVHRCPRSCGPGRGRLRHRASHFRLWLVRSASHSIAVAAPFRRVPRRRFPHRSAASRCLLWTPEAVGSHTPHSGLLALPSGALAALACPGDAGDAHPPLGKPATDRVHRRVRRKHIGQIQGVACHLFRVKAGSGRHGRTPVGDHPIARIVDHFCEGAGNAIAA